MVNDYNFDVKNSLELLSLNVLIWSKSFPKHSLSIYVYWSEVCI